MRESVRQMIYWYGYSTRSTQWKGANTKQRGKRKNKTHYLPGRQEGSDAAWMCDADRKKGIYARRGPRHAYQAGSGGQTVRECDGGSDRQVHGQTHLLVLVLLCLFCELSDSLEIPCVSLSFSSLWLWQHKQSHFHLFISRGPLLSVSLFSSSVRLLRSTGVCYQCGRSEGWAIRATVMQRTIKKKKSKEDRRIKGKQWRNGGELGGEACTERHGWSTSPENAYEKAERTYLGFVCSFIQAATKD